MIPKIIAIAGGTGAGKSTLAYALADKYPNKISLVHLDDYHWYGKDRSKVPLTAGMMNWDHPDAIDWKSLIGDLKKLRSGQGITIQSKNERLITQEEKENTETPTPRVPMTIEPKEIIVIEGYLSLWNEEVRKFLDSAIFLESNQETRLKRRTKFLNINYAQKILFPMHQKYVEPTKQYANTVIDVSKLTLSEVLLRVEQVLKNRYRI